ncbi:MAG: transglycosylase SLT domain-containing protein, partial [Luteimonas sp.]
MPALASSAFRLSAATILVLSLLVPFDAQAQSRRDRQAAEILQQRMDVAETRYREALVRARNNEPGAVTESDAALEDMEDVVVECGKLRGCDPANFVTTF